MPPLDPARLGLARLGGTRLGYPVAQGTVLPKYALLGVARLAATRLNFHSPKVFVSIGGVQYAYARPGVPGVCVAGLSINDPLNEAASTASLRVRQAQPTEGADVIITLGSINNLEREFAGQIINRTVGYLAKNPSQPLNTFTDLNLIDYTWGLGKRTISAQYTATTTVAAVVADLMTHASGYTSQVAADVGAEAIDQITFNDQDLPSCLTQLMGRVGGNWLCDYHKVVKLFYADTSLTDPTVLNAVHPTLSAMAVTRDLSQVITRVRSAGGGTNALQDIAVGETILPVENAIWYPTPSVIVDGRYTEMNGLFDCGAIRGSYTSVDLGGGGGLVGPGASPSGASALALASGAGIESGSHDYAVTFNTLAGESLPSPISTIAVGSVAAPASAPTAGTPTVGSGPDPGSHDYALTFVNAAGETTAGPRVTVATSLTAAPNSAPIANTPTPGLGVDNGTHDYAVTFTTSIGETIPSPISGQVTASGAFIASPSVAPTTSGVFNGTLTPVAGTYLYAYAFVNAYGETTPSPTANFVEAGGYLVYISNIATGPSGTVSRKIYRTTVGGSQLKLLATISDNTTTDYAYDNSSDGALGANAMNSNTTGSAVVPLTAIPTGSAEVTGRNLYRRSGGAGLKLLTTIANNSATTYTDTTPNASLGVAPPSVSTAYVQRIPLTNLPLGGSLVTSRKLYGTAAGASQLKLVATLNTTDTAYTVVTADASLGANVPTSNTATANQVNISGVPIGAAAVTSRWIYRTAVGSSQLKRLHQLADNTTTVWADSAADATLGANVPVSDGSGLAQPSGNVLAGSIELIVAGTGAFSSAGGWAIIGNGTQVIRYTGVTGSKLTGIPATGTGSIVATIGYNSTVTAAPCLRGIPASGPGSIAYAIKKGDAVNLVVQVDDVAAQSALAALIGGDGIQEAAIQDGRLAATEAIARAEAWLALKRDVLVTIRYTTRDINTRAGRTQTVNIGAPFNITDTDFMIQTVTESGFDPTRGAGPDRMPTFAVVASSVRYTFDRVLRQALEAAA